MTSPTDRWIARLLAASILLQAMLTLPHSSLAIKVQFQVCLVALAVAAFVHQLWLTRRHWSPHLDMLLLMAGFGGLSMALTSLPSIGLPPCHRSGSFLAMFIPMWLAGMLPALLWSRCLRQAREQSTLLAYLAIDGAGMATGMYAAHHATSLWALPFHHAAMYAGMLLGMGLAMPLRVVLWRPGLWNSSSDRYVSHPARPALGSLSATPVRTATEYPDAR